MAKKSQKRQRDLSQPRRFELIDGKSEKFWIIRLDENSHTVRYGRLGTQGQSKTKEFDDLDAALASYEKLVDQKLSKGYEEFVPPTAAELRRRRKQHEPFLKAILSDPDDATPYAVYADWLTEHGDPRGEFIHVQLQLEDEQIGSARRKKLRQREKQLLARYEEQWLGAYARLLMDNPMVRHGEYGPNGPNFKYRFERGFLASLRVARLYVSVARTIRDAPETRFLRELIIDSIEGEPYEGSDDFELAQFEPGPDVPTSRDAHMAGAYPLAGVREFSALHTFQVGDIGEEDLIDQRMPGNYRPGDCHCYCKPVDEIVNKMPGLKHLHLLCKYYDLEALFSSKKLKQLQTLRIYHLGERREQYAYPLDRLARNKTFANLRVLAFHPHYRQRFEESFLPLEQVKAVLYSKHLKNLTGLQLRLSDMGDEGCHEIVKSGILQRLKILDLRHGCVTDEGARILAECPDLKHLEFLDLARNGLTQEGIRALGRTGVSFQAGNQQTQAELDEQEYLRDGDFE